MFVFRGGVLNFRTLRYKGTTYVHVLTTTLNVSDRKLSLLLPVDQTAQLEQ